MTYSFGIGKVELKQSSVVIKSILPTKNIQINHNVTTSKELDADGVVTDMYVEEESTNITIAFAGDNFDADLAVHDEYDLVFTTVNSRGISVTLANCSLTSYTVTSSQGDFVTGVLTFSKIGGIDDAAGTTPTKQTVKFTKIGGGTVYLGDSAYVNTSYQGNANSFIIPTALGVLVQSTNDLGGGQLGIQVSCTVNKATRLELEQYMITLYSQITTESGTLTVEYGLSSYTIASCYWVNGSPSGSNKKHTTFSLSFLKSGY